MKQVTFSKKYLFCKSLVIAICYGLGLFLVRHFFAYDFYSLAENSIFTLLSVVLFFVVFYLFYSFIYLKKAEKLVFSAEMNEEIIKEEIVSYRKSAFSILHGKRWKTSKRIVFISNKNAILEIPLHQIVETKDRKNIVAHMQTIKTNDGKTHIFEIFS